MIAALALALGAALFTILGFRELFGPTFNITYMAATVEIGKIIAVSAIYQLRTVIPGWLKSSLVVLILVAMFVTSMGVYGFLSSAYEKDSLSITRNEAHTTLLDRRNLALEARLAGMDTQIANVPEAFVSKRMELMDKFAPERDKVMDEIDDLESEKLELTLERIDKESEFGAILLLARSFDGLEADEAMLYFIFLIIFIFDPMAIALTYTANIGYAHAVKRSIEVNKLTVDNSELSDKIDSFIVEQESDKQATLKVMKSITGTIQKVSTELDSMKHTKPSDSRVSVVDSMRQQTT